MFSIFKKNRNLPLSDLFVPFSLSFSSLPLTKDQGKKEEAKYQMKNLRVYLHSMHFIKLNKQIMLAGFLLYVKLL